MRHRGGRLRMSGGRRASAVRRGRLRVPGRRRAPAVRRGRGRLRVSGRCRAASRSCADGGRLRLPGCCRAPAVLTNRNRLRRPACGTRIRGSCGRRRRAEVRGGGLPRLRQLRQRCGPRRRTECVGQRNSADRRQAKTAQHDRQQPAQKDDEHDAAGASHPAGAPSGRILEHGRPDVAESRCGRRHPQNPSFAVPENGTENSL